MASVATLAVLGLLLGAAPAGAVVITGGPSYSPGGGWSCSTTAAGTEKLSGGATYTCSGTAGAFSNLYIGNNRLATAPIGEKMNSNGVTEPSGSEIFSWSSEGVNTIVYTGSTTISTYGTVFTRMTLTFSGSGSVVDDATTQALSTPNASVHSLWRIAPSVSSMTVNVLVEASDSAGGPWTPARTYFGTTTSHRRGTGSTDVDKSHVDIAFYTSTCGDGTLDTNFSAEQCDQGGANGSSTSCCTSTCAFRSAGSVCRASAGVCDPQETCTGAAATCPADARSSSGTPCTSDGNPCTLDQCDGSNVACQHPAGNAGTTCRAAAGVCDVSEVCDGTSTACPADLKSTAVCRGAAGTCDVAESCNGITNDCPPDLFQPSGFICRIAVGACDQVEDCSGTNPTCPPDAVLPAGTVCRAAVGDCDVAETCDGTSSACPADGFQPSSVECRASGGDCDVAENCTGSGPNCPADAFQPSSVVCRPSAGDCDVAENCTGSSATCPFDAKSTAECRAAVGDCDVAETCDGVNNACPADAVAPAVTICRPAAGDCDVAENCDGSSTACPADAVQPAGTGCRASAGACDIAETCDGSSAACPADAFQPSSVVCRPSAGDCDVAENCTGSSAPCPADSVAGAFVECRPAAGDCDAAENCDGTNPTCPADAFQPSSFTCRAAAGACDLAENCTGSSTTCPADVKNTGVCRAAAGTCDVAESCDGVSNTCPADTLQPAGTTCRAATGACDVAEVCTGASAACPPDIVVPNGTPCDDGNTCTTPDACQGGVCTGTPDPVICADHFLCYKIKTTGFIAIPNVQLADQFETATVTLVKPRQLCTPADKNGEGIFDQNTHLKTYRFKQATPHTRRTVTTVDQFGTLSLTTSKPELLMVPTAKDLVTPPAAPNPTGHNVNHYKCYKVKVTSGTPKFVRQQVTVGDQFNAPPKIFDLKKPKHLCNPVDKDGQGTIKNSDAHLVCYQAKGAKGQPKHVRRNVFVNNSVGPETLTTIKENELCVPAVKSL